MLSFNEEHRSWFTNETAYPHGNIYITSTFDPLFWALYYIRLNNGEMCQPIDHAITDTEFPKASLIADMLNVDQLSMVRYCKFFFLKQFFNNTSGRLFVFVGLLLDC